MDITLVIIIVLIIVVGMFFRDFKSVVYFIGILDILFRLLHKVSSLIKIVILNDFVSKYVPVSVEGLIDSYSSGILNTILIWGLIVIYFCFLYYLIVYWIKKKK